MVAEAEAAPWNSRRGELRTHQVSGHLLPVALHSGQLTVVPRLGPGAVAKRVSV